MSALRLLSWNVNGIRAVEKKGLLTWLQESAPDILCLQETKAEPDQLGSALLSPAGYHVYWDFAQRRGYSGVSVFSREEPVEVKRGFGVERFDAEGRVLVARYPGYQLFNVYFPNGQSGNERLTFKLEFYDAFLEHIVALKDKGEKLVICGDFNTAHKALDLARPKENATNSGFLPQERAWLDRLVANGFADTFRMFETEGGHYTYWDMKIRARERNVGWRIDYFFVSDNLRSAVVDAGILSDVMGSDHCPVSLALET